MTRVGLVCVLLILTIFRGYRIIYMRDNLRRYYG